MLDSPKSFFFRGSAAKMLIEESRIGQVKP